MSEQLKLAQTAEMLNIVADGQTLVLGGGTPGSRDLTAAERIVDDCRGSVASPEDGTLCTKTVTPQYIRIIKMHGGKKIEESKVYAGATDELQHCGNLNCRKVNIQRGSPVILDELTEEV